MPASTETWDAGDAYEAYMGRWSRMLAREALAWLEVPEDRDWLDLGCGTGALSQAILATRAPRSVTGLDASSGYVNYARTHTEDPRASFVVGDAQALPDDLGPFDAAASGLMLNFLSSPAAAVAGMRRVTRPGGSVAAYVWDYAEGMQFIRSFFLAAAEVIPAAAELDEGRRFPICHPEPLAELFRQAQLTDVEVRPIEIPTVFRDFDDYWTPFLGGQGAAPHYAMSVSEDERAAIREQLRASLPTQPDGSIHMTARAWGVKGQR
jgi:SAM-dependent methyltransferase